MSRLRQFWFNYVVLVTFQISNEEKEQPKVSQADLDFMLGSAEVWREVGVMHYPDREVALLVYDIFEESVVKYFHKLFATRQKKQLSIDQFEVKHQKKNALR